MWGFSNDMVALYILPFIARGYIESPLTLNDGYIMWIDLSARKPRSEPPIIHGRFFFLSADEKILAITMVSFSSLIAVDTLYCSIHGVYLFSIAI
jgi:hypothetical protein